MTSGDVRTQDETLLALANAISSWMEESKGALESSATGTRNTLYETTVVLGRRAARVNEITNAIYALPADADASSLQVQLQRAQDSLAIAKLAQEALVASVEEIQQLQNRMNRESSSLAMAARSELLDLIQAVENYRTVGFNVLDHRNVANSSRTAPSNTTRLNGIYSRLGLKEVNLSEIDFGDNPIIGEWGRGELTKPDYRWALETWRSVVSPGIENGMTRDDFEARDQARHVDANRRTTSSYDMILGSDPIRVDKLMDGSRSVTGGRHRIEVARELGIISLPMKVTETEQ